MRFELRHKKVKGSTVTEVTIAMVVISIVLALAFMTYANIIKSSRFKIKQHARLVANFADTNWEEDYIDMEEEVNGLLVEVRYLPFNEDPLLIWKNIQVKDVNGKLLYTRKKVIKKTDQTGLKLE